MLRIGQIEATATADKKYTDGSVAGGVAATRLRAAAFNAMQEELAHIVETAGADLDVNDMTQVLTALQKLFAGNTDSLGALGALVGAADKLPYFTGSKAAALTAFTEVGRNIVGKETVADVLSYLGIGVGGRLINVQTYTATVPYVKTPGTRFIIVELIGGGGASGAVTATGASQYSITTPGAMGAYAKAKFTADFEGKVITIGSGGIGSTGAGTAGGNSSFGDLLICPGGPGSSVGALGTLPVVTGGPSGAAAPTITGGTLIESEYGQTTPPAAAIAAGVFLNYVTTDRSQLGNVGIGGNGFYNSVSSSIKVGLNGGNGGGVVWEFS